jgi:DNA-binding PadR family transcriptional regulator
VFNECKRSRRHGRQNGPDQGHGHDHGPGAGPDQGRGRPGFGHMGSHGRGFGGGRDFAFGPGFMPGFGPGPGRGRGYGVRRGDVKDAILTALATEPMHGYGVIQTLTELSGGRWRPSAGSIYPTLQQLEDEGLVAAEERDGRRVFVLTETGRAAAAEASTRGGPRWDSTQPTEGADGATNDDLREAFHALGAAVSQAAQVGGPETRAGAKIILVDARKAIYRLLAEEDEAVKP